MLKTGREWCPDCLQKWQNSDRDIMDYLKGAGKEDRNAQWSQKYSADAPTDRISDDDYLR